MKITMHFFLILIVLSSYSFASNLKCSKNGTEIIYVNGMNNTEGVAETSRKKIDDMLKLMNSSIDSQSKVNVSKVYNEGLGIGNDIIEYVIDRARLVGISDPWKYYEVFSVSTGIDNALKQKVERRGFLPAGPTALNSLSLIQLSILRGIYNSYFTSTAALKASNTKLQDELKGSILDKLTADKKVILVAHSQGNTVINAATQTLPTTIGGIDKVGKFLGALHVATPANSRAAVKSRMIKLNSDRVVRFAPVSESANYEFNYLGVGASYLPDVALFGLDALSALGASGYLMYQSPALLGHDMSEIYLGNRAARKIGSSDEYKSMSDIFKQNIVEVAEELEDNCPIDLTICNGGNPYDNMTFNVESVGSFELGHLLNRDSNGVNTFTCECKKIKAERGQTFAVHVDAVELPTYPSQPLTPILSYDGIITAPQYSSTSYTQNFTVDNAYYAPGTQQLFKVIQGEAYGTSCDYVIYK